MGTTFRGAGAALLSFSLIFAGCGDADEAELQSEIDEVQSEVGAAVDRDQVELS